MNESHRPQPEGQEGVHTPSEPDYFGASQWLGEKATAASLLNGLRAAVQQHPARRLDSIRGLLVDVQLDLNELEGRYIAEALTVTKERDRLQELGRQLIDASRRTVTGGTTCDNFSPGNYRRCGRCKWCRLRQRADALKAALDKGQESQAPAEPKEASRG